jgi:outer membrane receptor protein involved in Fe transport
MSKLFLFLSFLSYSFLSAENIQGLIKDIKGEPIPGVEVSVLNSNIKTISIFDGSFEINITNYPSILVFKHTGYETKNDTIQKFGLVTIILEEKAKTIKSATVSSNKVKEKRKESPVTIESMGMSAIKETPAANFYEGLGHLKGVDMVSASLGFRIINTRGFNSTRPVRSLQLLDGVDNQAPGLNFALGNFAGALDIDLLRADIIVGANSATFGPNAFNGVISMVTKDPFKYQGLTVQVKAGERNLFETQLRYARAYKNSKGKEIAAFKFGAMVMSAYDWVADNYSQTNGSYQASNNPGGYDAVNRYGDENLTGQTNNFLGGTFRWDYPGLGVFHRTGYKEIELVDYNTKNIKLNGAFHYKMKRNIRAIASYNLGYGTTVYQGDNRYSLKDIVFQQYKLELSKENNWFIRGYATRENAGNSYDAVFTAVLLQNRVKSNSQFLTDYLDGYVNEVFPLLSTIPGGANVYSQIPLPLANRKTSDSLMGLFSTQELLRQWHQLARNYADGPGLFNEKRLEPGTPAFNQAFNQITSNSTYLDGGSRFFDKSALYHIMGEKKLKIKKFDLSFGGSFRLYTPNSRGTIFCDTGGRKIYNHEFGSFAQSEKKLFSDRLKVTLACRLDKNRNFNFLVSPAASLVFNSKDKKNYYRLSFTSAIRNPTLQDQYLYYNVGRAILLGNINGISNMLEIPSLFNYLNSLGADRSLLKYVNLKPVVPEKVKSIEIGYKGEPVKNLLIDVSYFYSWYKDFLGFRLLSDTGGFVFGKSFQFYRIAANSEDVVTTQGFSAGINYFFEKSFNVSGNYSWNRLDRRGSSDPIIPAFNTPEHKFNIGFGGTDLVIRKSKSNKTLKHPNFWKDYGFNLNYKWNKGFLYEGSPQFTGFVPSYDMLDVQVNKKIIKSKATLKIGASNVLNNMKFQVYGGPRIGRMAYISILFELDKI